MKKWIAVGVLTLIMLGSSWYIYINQPTEEVIEEVPLQPDQPVAEIPLDPAKLKTRQVTVFVVDPATGKLVRRIGEIQESQDLIQTLAATVQRLIQPEANLRNAAIPEGTELLSVFMSNAGTVYLNLNRNLQDRHIGGISAELTTIAALVDTVLFNFKEIRQVQILVEGAEIETLAGHIDCRKPFAKMLQLS